MPEKKKRVLLLLPVFDLGGAEKRALLMATHMQNSGMYDVEVWALIKSGGMLIPKLDENNIVSRVLEIPFSSFQGRISRLKAYWRFLWMLRKSKFDVILPFTYHCNVMAASVFRMAGVKKCLWFQAAMEHHIPLSFFEKLALKMKPIYASNSRAAGDFIAKKHSVDAASVIFVPNLFEQTEPIDSREKWLEKLNIGSDKIIMVMSANFFLEKDHDTLVKGLKILLQKHPSLVLVFAGRLSPDTIVNRVKALAFDLHLVNEVKFIGSTNDIAGLLAISHIGILSSRSEGSPNSVIEYMGYGLPVIGTEIPPIRELVGKDYPYLFEVENVDDFVQKADLLISNLHSTAQLIEKNKAIIGQTYTAKANFEAFHQLISNA